MSPSYDDQVLVMGDFFIQEVILKSPPSPRHPEVDASPYHHFAFHSGCVLLDFLTQCAKQYLWLKDQTGDGKKIATAYPGQAEKSIGQINGPCALQGWSGGKYTPDVSSEALRLKIRGMARKEHITIAETKPAESSKGRKALRITEVQGHSGHVPETVKREFHNDVSLTLMSCDFHSFLTSPISEYFTVAPDKGKSPFGKLCVRMVLGPGVNLDEEIENTGKNKVDTILENLGAVTSYCDQSILVIGSNSLRNFGVNISFRRSWERTIQDTLVALEKGPASETFAQFDFIVVTFFNDAALVVRCKPHFEKARFVFHPISLEGDLSLRIDGSTKGTETLVTQALACARLKENVDFDEAVIERAVIKGLKASRFQLLRGYSRTDGEDWNDVSESLNITTTSKDKVLLALKPKEEISDVTKYLWNRSRKNAFFKMQEQLCGTDVSSKKLLCTWPYGDTIEILCDGHVSYGSFPPTSVENDLAREKVEQSTRDTASAFRNSGWLQSVTFERVPAKATLSCVDPSQLALAPLLTPPEALGEGSDISSAVDEEFNVPL